MVCIFETGLDSNLSLVDGSSRFCLGEKETIQPKRIWHCPAQKWICLWLKMVCPPTKLACCIISKAIQIWGTLFWSSNRHRDLAGKKHTHEEWLQKVWKDNVSGIDQLERSLKFHKDGCFKFLWNQKSHTMLWNDGFLLSQVRAEQKNRIMHPIILPVCGLHATVWDKIR